MHCNEIDTPASPARRRLLFACTAAGLGQTLFPGVLLALASQGPTDAKGSGVADAIHPAGVPKDKLPKITPAMIEAAEALAAISLTPAQREMLVSGLTEQRDSVEVIRSLHLGNSTAPAFVFDPVPPGMSLETVRKPPQLGPAPDVQKLIVASAGPTREEDLAFATVREQAELLRTRKLKSVELTKLYLERLKLYQPQLLFVITLTEQRAMDAAAAADREIAAGRYRGPLHGTVWGAKDLLAVKGYPTTWGAAGFEQQSFDFDATVVQRLDTAGAVLAAKTTLGALAQGDLWGYPAGPNGVQTKPGGRTRNPWNTKQGSSGSSAGSASAVSAGCVSFAIGTETLGSISSPSTRCGVTGHRPSFGLVPRSGAMALSWTMDKIGPIARSVEDCELVLSAIAGSNAPGDTAGFDLACKPAAYNWDATLDWRTLRVGYLKSEFDDPKFEELPAPKETLSGKALADFNKQKERQRANFERSRYDHRYLTAALAALKQMGVKLKPVEMPKGLHFGDQVPLLEAEAAAAFDELTLSGRDALLSGQQDFDWPNAFRTARFYSAVDYIQAQRARTLVIAAMSKLFDGLDVIVTPTFGAQLVATNLTGQPAIIVPNGLRGADAPAALEEEGSPGFTEAGPGTPVSLTFLGPLYSDARLAAFARAYQEKTGFHKLRPKLSAELASSPVNR